MYSSKEIKVSLRKYIASTGDTSIDEQSIIAVLDAGADRDFDKAVQIIKPIRDLYGVKRAIPMWLRMLTFRLIYDCMASDADCNSEMTWYKLLGYENKVRELFCIIGVNQNIQNLLLSAKGDKIKIDTILLDMVLGKESSQIIKELQKSNIKDSIKEKLNEIGIAQDVQDMLWEVQVKKGSTKEKQIKEILIKSALGSDYEQVYNLLLSQAKSQENLLKSLGFNKKVFDVTSWNMYSPTKKLQQSKFEPVNFPFSYAEVESNPIYVAMLHHLISEARVPTDTFIDVFGKMGYVPAFCAEGYAHKLLYSAIPDGDYDADVFYKYYHGITDRPTKTYKVLQRYMAQIQSVLDEKYDEDERDLRIRKIVSDKVLFIAMGSSDLCEYSAIKFCDMCFRKPYWEERSVENHIVEKKKERKLHGKVYQTTEKIVEKDKDRIIIHDYSSIPKAEDYLKITKEMFVAYAAALKNVKFMGDTTSLIDGVYENMDAASIYEELDIDKELSEYFKEIVHDKTPLLYVDVPKYGEYIRFNFSDEEYMKLLEFLLIYKGDWILSFKRYNQARGDYVSEKYSIKDFLERMKASERPLFEYKYSTKDRNVRNSISFITTIDFDELTVQEFKNKYNLESAKINSFQKIQVNI